MSRSPTILWFRQDLRLEDNAALNAAIARGGPIVPLYIRDEAGEQRWAPGGASRWWLHHSLAALEQSLQAMGARLVLAKGDSAQVLRQLVRDTAAEALMWNRRYEPAIAGRDKRIEDEFKSAGLEVKTFNSALLREPAEVANQQGRPFQIFTAYWRRCLTLPVSLPVPFRATRLPGPAKWPRSLSRAELNLLSDADSERDFAATWTPGEVGARKGLRGFVARNLEGYADERDMLARGGTSRLSPHLHFGEIGPRQIWAAVKAVGRTAGIFPPSRGAGVFLTELGWREFAYHTLAHFPASPERPIRADFARFPWVKDPRGKKLRAWERGLTGYPVVDAGMRQLRLTGWMHNRARMIVASFLVKHLRLPWVQGAGWFWDNLVDADLANNTLGWQWSAGCGGDAAPYFRIFSPVLQGRKFDPAGEYVRRWVPELARVPTAWIHEPWNAPAGVLESIGMSPESPYPAPLVDHATARDAALAAYRQMKDQVSLHE